jgi:hypothetical protein
MTRTIPVCSGQLISATITQSAGPSSPLLFQFMGARRTKTFASGQTVPGATQPNYVTVPRDSHEVLITVTPLPGGVITKTAVERLGFGMCTAAIAERARSLSLEHPRR